MKSLWIASVALALTQAASATVITYETALSGANETPPSGSTATGFAIVTIDTIAQSIEVNVTYSDLAGPSTAAFIHCCTGLPGTGNAGVATQVPSFTGFPLGVTSGTYDQVFNLTLDTFYNPPFEAANGGTAATAEAALLAGMAADEAYLSIHSTVDPNGEISGFLVPVRATPEPATFLMAGGALAGLAMLRRKRAA